jgi:hypothetical protein
LGGRERERRDLGEILGFNEGDSQAGGDGIGPCLSVSKILNTNIETYEEL